MRVSLAFACFVAGTVAFLRFFYLAWRLRKERLGAHDGWVQRWFPWLPGQFTPAGEGLRHRMNLLMLVGWAFLVAGLLLGYT